MERFHIDLPRIHDGGKIVGKVDQRLRTDSFGSEHSDIDVAVRPRFPEA